MIDTDETSSPAQPAAPHAPNRLFRALAWVGIAAGSLFVFGGVFFSGFFVGGGHVMSHHADSASMPCCDHAGMSHHDGMQHHM